jgi:hypothetical protein
MTVDSSLVDRIVHGVLRQLEGPPAAEKPAVVAAPASSTVAAAPKSAGSDHPLAQSVITARLIEEQVPRAASVVVVSPKAIITPAALDVVRARKLVIRRETGASPQQLESASPLLAIVVRNSPVVERLSKQRSWRRELLGCPDDAAKLAISALARGEASAVVIFAVQNHRAACFANRNAAVKAAAVNSFDGLRSVLDQLRLNVLCIDPTGLSDFEVTRMVDFLESRRGAAPAKG